MGYILLLLVIIGVIWFGTKVLKGVLNVFSAASSNNRRNYNQQQNNSQHESSAQKNKQFEKTEGKYVDYEEITD